MNLEAIRAGVQARKNLTNIGRASDDCAALLDWVTRAAALLDREHGGGTGTEFTVEAGEEVEALLSELTDN